MTTLNLIMFLQVPCMAQQPGALPFFLASQAPQIVPVPVAGPNGAFQTAYTLQLASASSTSSALDPSGSLDLGEKLLPIPQSKSHSRGWYRDVGGSAAGGVHPSQFLLSQPGAPGNSAFQAVKPACPDRQGEPFLPLLCSPAAH